MKYKKQILFVTTFFFSITTTVGQSPVGKSKRISSLGIFGGVGIVNFNLSKSNWSQPINYADSLNAVASMGAVSVNFGLYCQIDFNRNLNLRPAVSVILGETGKLSYQKPVTTEVLNFRSVAESLTVPLIYKFNSKKIKPYIDLGPTILWHFGEKGGAEAKMRLKYIDLLGVIGLGIEIPTKYFKVAPELAFSQGFINAKKGNINNLYNNTISSLHRQLFNLTFYLSDND